MKLTNILLMGYSLSFIVLNTVGCNPNIKNNRAITHEECIGFLYNNSSSESQVVTIYYGAREYNIDHYMWCFDEFEEKADCEVKLSIRRSVYESTLKKKEECPCKETEIYSETLIFRDFFTYDYYFGNNSVVDTITKDDLYNNEDGYGYIIYDLCFTEVDGVDNNDIMKYYFNNKEVVTQEIYYTIDDNLITFKIAKQEN